MTPIMGMFAVPLLAMLSFLVTPPVASAADIRVGPGQSIQAAVDRASPGDRIRVQPGVYHERGQPCPTDPTTRCAVVISLDDLSLIGEGAPGRPVVIENAGGAGDRHHHHARRGASSRLPRGSGAARAPRAGRRNTCPPDDPVCLLPPGIGILVVGGRRT